MTAYRLYRLDGSGSISLAEWIKATDDDDALCQAQALTKDALKFELWQGSRLVAASDDQRLTG